MLHLLYSFLPPKEPQIPNLFDHTSRLVNFPSRLEHPLGVCQFRFYFDQRKLGLPQALKVGIPLEVEDLPRKLLPLVQGCLSWWPKTVQSFQWGQFGLILCYTAVTCFTIQQALLAQHSSYPWSLHHTIAEFLELCSSQLQARHACCFQLPYGPD